MVSPAPGTITSIDSQRLHGSQREATELRAQAASVDDAKPSSSKTSTEPRIEHKNKARQLLSSFWRRQVAVTVSHEDCRDHFANERTFLAYLRTSSVFATLGVAVVQLFRLTSSSDSTNDVDFGVPFACVCIGLAIIITFCGGFRFWRQQNAMARGKCHAGGWEVYLVGGIGLTVLLLAFCIVMVTNIEFDSG